MMTVMLAALVAILLAVLAIELFWPGKHWADIAELVLVSAAAVIVTVYGVTTVCKAMS